MSLQKNHLPNQPGLENALSTGPAGAYLSPAECVPVAIIR